MAGLPAGLPPGWPARTGGGSPPRHHRRDIADIAGFRTFRDVGDVGDVGDVSDVGDSGDGGDGRNGGADSDICHDTDVRYYNRPGSPGGCGGAAHCSVTLPAASPAAPRSAASDHSPPSSCSC
eukprot:gene14365-biopygen8720